MDAQLAGSLAMQSFVVLSLGFASSAHCLAMCGGIAASVSASPSEAKNERHDDILASDAQTILASSTAVQDASAGSVGHGSLWHVFVFNGGRLLSYAIAGALVATLVSGLSGIADWGAGLPILRVVAGVFTVLYGVNLLGWRWRMPWAENLTMAFWRQLQPAMQFFLPPRTTWQFLALGALWGWLPCGMVYAALLYAATAGHMLGGAWLMLLFGLGTMPAMLAIGAFASWWRQRLRGPWWRRVLAMLVIAMGCIMLLLALRPGGHAHHAPPPTVESGIDEHHMHHHH